MRASRWRLAAALSPILLAIAACADDTVTGSGVVTLASRGSSNVAVVTRPSISIDSGFGSGVVRGGVTGVIIPQTQTSSAPTAQPVYQATLNLTVNGNPPGNWHDTTSLFNASLDMVPLADNGITAFGQVTQNARVDFTTGIRGTYHIIYNDHDRPSSPEQDAEGKQHLDMLGFFVTNALYYDGNLSISKNLDLDLYWDTQAEPYSSDARTNNTTGQYVTYTDLFRTKPYRGVYLDSLPDNERDCMFRFVVKNTQGSGNVVWQSKWHPFPDPESSDPDFIAVKWNGYSSRASGPADMPPETDATNRLPEGLYFYSIEFYPKNTGTPPAGTFRSTTDHGKSFIATYYGASQWYGFQLKHGINKNASPAPGTSPTPSPTPRPTATPTVQPTLSPTPDQISL